MVLIVSQVIVFRAVQIKVEGVFPNFTILIPIMIIYPYRAKLLKLISDIILVIELFTTNTLTLLIEILRA